LEFLGSEFSIRFWKVIEYLGKYGKERLRMKDERWFEPEGSGLRI
jgi:hypothetical protein